MDAILDLVVAGNAAQIGDPAFVQELLDWLRFSPASAASHGDGLLAASSGNPELDTRINARFSRDALCSASPCRAWRRFPAASA